MHFTQVSFSALSGKSLPPYPERLIQRISTMADPTQKFFRNLPGAYYNDTSCIDCDLCQSVALRTDGSHERTIKYGCACALDVRSTAPRDPMPSTLPKKQQAGSSRKNRKDGVKPCFQSGCHEQ